MLEVEVGSKAESIRVEGGVMQGVMSVMGAGGDTKIIWDSENEVEVENARRTFQDLKKKGFNAYQVKRKGDKGEVVQTFDPDAERYILAPPMSGG